MKHPLVQTLVLACAVFLTGNAQAADHGPVFSYSTPVNSQREFSFDTGMFGRGGSAGTQLSTGSSIGYGITPHFTVNAFLPASFGSGSDNLGLPESRIFSGSEWAATGSWRFLHSVTSVGKRIESTATAGLVLPGPQSDSGILQNLHRAPGLTTSLATGFASRSSYLWLGGGYSRFLTSEHTRRPNTLSWSTVYGYRPARLRRGYDQWDYRGFAEFTGERTGAIVLNSHDVAKSKTSSLWLGPSILAIHRNIAIEGGIQAPLYRDASEQLYGREQLRFALNFSYLKYSAHTSAH